MTTKYNNTRGVIIGVVGLVVNFGLLVQYPPSWFDDKRLVFMAIVGTIGCITTIAQELRMGIVPYVTVPAWACWGGIGFANFLSAPILWKLFLGVWLCASLAFIVRGGGDVLVATMSVWVSPVTWVVGIIEGLASTIKRQTTCGAPALAMSVSLLSVVPAWIIYYVRTIW